MINTKLNDLTNTDINVLIDAVKCLHYSMYYKTFVDKYCPDHPTEKEISETVDAELRKRGIEPSAFRPGIMG